MKTKYKLIVSPKSKEAKKSSKEQKVDYVQIFTHSITEYEYELNEMKEDLGHGKETTVLHSEIKK